MTARTGQLGTNKTGGASDGGITHATGRCGRALTASDHIDKTQQHGCDATIPSACNQVAASAALTRLTE